MIVELFVVHEVPLSACILIAPSIALAWEVYPLWVTKLVAHEVEITTVDSCCRHQAYHLVQGDASMHGAVLVSLLEMPVHIGIDEPEDECFVSHKGLVMTLTVGDGLLVGTTVFHLPEDGAGFPVFISQFLDGLYPVVGDVHRHAVVEPISTVLIACCQSWHATHLFSDGDGVGIHLVDEEVGEGEIADGIVILMTVEIVGIATEGFAQSMTVIEHRGDTIEAEAVETILFHPITAVGEQEMNNLILAIIETEAIPGGMLVAVTRIEELVGVAGKVTESLHLILHGMRMYDIHDHRETHLMGGIDEFLQFFRGAKTT